jgi:class 3 adenylate cyclase
MPCFDRWVELEDLRGITLADDRVERRLAAVLAADVAGYSRLMGVNEEGTLARLKAARKDIVDPRYSFPSWPHRQDHR